MNRIVKQLKSITLLALFFGSFVAFASDNRLSKEEFLQRVIEGKLQLERAPVFAINPNIYDKLVEKQKKKYPNIKSDNFYYYEIRDNNFVYSLFWEFDLGNCTLRIEEIDKKLGKPNEKTMDVKGQTVAKKYCDKVYGYTL